MTMNRAGTLQSGETSLTAINVGTSGSDLIATVNRQARLALASGNPRKAVQVGLQHLEQRGLISRAEHQSLSRMCDAALVGSAGGKRGLAAAERIGRLHDALVLKSSSPIAVSIAGAILQHYTAADGGFIAQRGQNPAAGFLGAVVAGGLLGGLLGGGAGAVIGVVAGAVGALTDCSDPD
jgi:hypothetical protein